MRDCRCVGGADRFTYQEDRAYAKVTTGAFHLRLSPDGIAGSGSCADRILAWQTVRRYTKAAAMRVYVPLTLPDLQAAHSAGELVPERGAILAYAVTPGLREWYVSDDSEELEYAALNRAAQSSLRLLAARPDAPRRRVVVAADVPDGEVAFDPDQVLDRESLGEVRIASPVQLSEAAAVHVDADDAEADVSAAADALGAADMGDEDARFTVDGAEDHELLWYGVQEIPHVFGR